MVFLSNERRTIRRLISQYKAILSFFHGGHLENHPKWRSGPKISSVNILILNQGGSNEKYYTTPRGSLGGACRPPGPWTIPIDQK